MGASRGSGTLTKTYLKKGPRSSFFKNSNGLSKTAKQDDWLTVFLKGAFQKGKKILFRRKELKGLRQGNLTGQENHKLVNRLECHAGAEEQSGWEEREQGRYIAK